ncbi:MAG: glutathione peroxidase [Gammaproteobacteria bacterium]|nr:glutathione peroxidase [Gammaproteobacteria bacterium]
MSEFYKLAAEGLDGQVVSFDTCKGQVVLVVNTASLCGFTPQYAGLEALYRKYRDQGFVILGFPCNQFGHQEPGDAAAIAATCRARYGVTFPVFAKVEVNGAGAHPLFAWLTQVLPGWFGRRIRWNFTKFLIDREGHPRRRFAPHTRPAQLERAIAKALRG